MATPWAAIAVLSTAVLRKVRNNLDLPREMVDSAVAARRNRRYFESITNYCMFLGYPRSGHSLVGSLLDAHPDAVIAHELDALRLVQSGFRRNQILSLALANSQTYGQARQHIYDYSVANQWQGRFRRIRVIGDKKGGRSTRRLAEAPALLGRLERRMGLPVRFVHVLRNPFDNIATMFTRGGPSASLPATIDTYTLLCDTVAQVQARVDPGSMLDLRHEDLIAGPAGQLTRLTGFLGLDASAAYLADCASILYQSPNRTRSVAPWTPELRGRVDTLISRFGFLGDYSFDS